MSVCVHVCLSICIMTVCGLKVTGIILLPKLVGMAIHEVTFEGKRKDKFSNSVQVV